MLRGVLASLLVGTAFRAVSSFFPVFWPVATGKLICGISNAFLNNVQTIIVNRWFPENEWAKATSMLVVASPIGAGVAYTLVGAWFYEVTEDTDPEVFLGMF